MKRRAIYALLMTATLAMTGCGAKSDTKLDTTEKGQERTKQSDVTIEELSKQFDPPKAGEMIATLHVKDYGDIKVKFFPDVAPKAVENFTTHAKEGYYNGLTFHRVIEDFVIQGGDPQGDGRGGESIWKKPFEDEFPNNSPMPYPYTGALAMANAGPGTNGSQFFIIDSKPNPTIAKQLKAEGAYDAVVTLYEEHGATPHLFGKHTVFGQVYEGMDVVHAIATAPKKDAKAGITETPVVIESIDIARAE